MAKRTANPPAPQRANLSPTAMQAAIPQIENRIEELRAFDPSTITDGDGPEVERINARIEQTLARIYGPDSHEYNSLRPAFQLDQTQYMLAFAGNRSTSVQEVQSGVDRGRLAAIALLEETAAGLKEALQYAHGPSQSPQTVPKIPAPTMTKQVFVVHGQDNSAKSDVTLLLTRAGLEPIILHEQPNGGRTIIEKFERYAGAVGFAVILMTPDDEGGPRRGVMNPRARQNVIGEMFWFAAKLGRGRVCALRRGNVEIPSDFFGVVYTEMDDRGAWKAQLLKELADAGYGVDWPKAMA